MLGIKISAVDTTENGSSDTESGLLLSKIKAYNQ